MSCGTREYNLWNQRDMVFPVQTPHAVVSEDVKLSAYSDEIQLEKEELILAKDSL